MLVWDEILRRFLRTWNDLLALYIIFLFNALPCASELIVGYQFLSETALRMFLILYITLGHYKG